VTRHNYRTSTVGDANGPHDLPFCRPSEINSAGLLSYNTGDCGREREPWENTHWSTNQTNSSKTKRKKLLS